MTSRLHHALGAGVRRSRELTRGRRSRKISSSKTRRTSTPGGRCNSNGTSDDPPQSGCIANSRSRMSSRRTRFGGPRSRRVAARRRGVRRDQGQGAEVAKPALRQRQRIDIVTTWLAAMTGDRAPPWCAPGRMCPVADTIVAFESLMQRFQTEAPAPTRRPEDGSTQPPAHHWVRNHFVRAAPCRAGAYGERVTMAEKADPGPSARDRSAKAENSRASAQPRRQPRPIAEACELAAEVHTEENDMSEPKPAERACATCLALGHFTPATCGPALLHCAEHWGSAPGSLRGPAPPAEMQIVARRALIEAAFAPPQPGKSIH